MIVHAECKGEDFISFFHGDQSHRPTKGESDRRNDEVVGWAVGDGGVPFGRGRIAVNTKRKLGGQEGIGIVIVIVILRNAYRELVGKGNTTEIETVRKRRRR